VSSVSETRERITRSQLVCDLNADEDDDDGDDRRGADEDNEDVDRTSCSRSDPPSSRSWWIARRYGAVDPCELDRIAAHPVRGPPQT
jgi:hypothetical protein